LEAYLVYASTALVVLAGIALGLSSVFRYRLRRLAKVSKNPVANVFNRTFVVFDPYSQRTIFHRFLILLPLLPPIMGFAAAVLLFVIINAGLLLTLLISIVGLSLIVVEESVEALEESKLLLSAIESKSDFGVGDVRLLISTKQRLPRLSRYYLVLSTCLFALAWVLPFVWLQFLWGFGMALGMLIWASAFIAGPIYLLAVALYALGLTAISCFVRMVKTRILGSGEEAV
jgi:hypothetical protein